MWLIKPLDYEVLIHCRAQRNSCKILDKYAHTRYTKPFGYVWLSIIFTVVKNYSSSFPVLRSETVNSAFPFTVSTDHRNSCSAYWAIHAYMCFCVCVCCFLTSQCALPRCSQHSSLVPGHHHTGPRSGMQPAWWQEHTYCCHVWFSLRETAVKLHWLTQLLFREEITFK